MNLEGLRAKMKPIKNDPEIFISFLEDINIDNGPVFISSTNFYHFFLRWANKQDLWNPSKGLFARRMKAVLLPGRTNRCKGFYIAEKTFNKLVTLK